MLLAALPCDLSPAAACLASPTALPLPQAAQPCSCHASRARAAADALPSCAFFTFFNTHQSLNCVAFTSDAAVVAGGAKGACTEQFTCVARHCPAACSAASMRAVPLPVTALLSQQAALHGTLASQYACSGAAPACLHCCLVPRCCIGRPPGATRLSYLQAALPTPRCDCTTCGLALRAAAAGRRPQMRRGRPTTGYQPSTGTRRPCLASTFPLTTSCCSAPPATAPSGGGATWLLLYTCCWPA